MPYQDRKSTRLNSSHGSISYAVFCLKKKKKKQKRTRTETVAGLHKYVVTHTPLQFCLRNALSALRSPLAFFFLFFFFFFNDTATTEIYTLSLHDALPIYNIISADSSGIDGNGCRF